MKIYVIEYDTFDFRKRKLQVRKDWYYEYKERRIVKQVKTIRERF